MLTCIAGLLDALLVYDEMNIVHGNLSLNDLCVVKVSTLRGKEYIIKLDNSSSITENGTCRILSSEGILIKSTSPETLSTGICDKQNDIWGFGTTLWSLFSNGDTPYDEFSGQKAMQMIMRGTKLEKPALLDNMESGHEIWQMISSCFNDHDSRPSLTKLREFFAGTKGMKSTRKNSKNSKKRWSINASGLYK